MVVEKWGGIVRGFLRRRSGSVSSLAVGSLVVVLFGSILAVTSDSINITLNDVQSKAYDSPAPALELGTPDLNYTTGCNNPDHPVSNYSNADTSQAITQSFGTGFDWATSGIQQSPSAIVCLKNSGNATGSLSVSLANIQDLENGACTPSESNAGDTTCAPDAQGELSQFVRVFAASTATPGYSTSDSCIHSAQATMSSLEATPFVLDATLAPGEVCWVSLDVRAWSDNTFPPVSAGGFPVMSENDRLISQTDSVNFDIVLSIGG